MKKLKPRKKLKPLKKLKPFKERRFRFGRKPIHIRSSTPIPKRVRHLVNNNRRPFPLDPIYYNDFKEPSPKPSPKSKYRLGKTFQYIPIRQYLSIRREFEFRRKKYSRCSSKYRIRLHKKSLRSRRRFFIPSRNQIHYKNIDLIGRFIGFQGKIIPRRVTKITLRQQRLITTAIKKARIICLLPFLKTEQYAEILRRRREILKRRREEEKKKKNEKRFGFKKTNPFGFKETNPFGFKQTYPKTKPKSKESNPLND